MPEEDGRKIAGLVYADVERGALGNRSYLAEELAGENVLRRTIQRLEKVKQLQEIVVFTPEGQQEEVKKLLAGTSAVVEGLKEPAPISPRIQRRKWALESWRGGLHEAMQADELCFTAEMVQKARQRDVYTAVVVNAEAVLLAGELMEGMLEHHREHGEEMRFSFTQAPPGLCGWALRLDLLHELVQAKTFTGDILAYNPDQPRADFVVEECNYKIPIEIYEPTFRYLADTRRGVEALQKILAANKAASNGQLRELVSAMAQVQREGFPLPRELEVEITTEPSRRMKGYPHGGRGQQRQMMSREVFEKIIGDCQGYDDICLTIGGFGEPMRHPQLLEMIKAAKAGGIFGINIETDGAGLKGKLAEGVIESGVDVISVHLDADSSEGYRQVKGQEDFEEIVRQMEAFIEKSQAAKGGGPQLVPHLVKTRRTMSEMEAFYERWIRKCGCAVIEGYNDFAGQLETGEGAEEGLDIAGPVRQACRRLWRCMTIMADGSVTICGQDYKGKCVFGNVKEQSVAQLWQGPVMRKLRQAHQDGDFEINELCRNCKEWHR